MDLRQFETDLKSEISSLPYITSVSLKKRTEISIQGNIGIKKNYKLSVFFNEAFFVLSFSLIYKNKRIWAIDKDNRVGWHEHPIENPDSHKPIKEMSINQIIDAFDKVCSKILED